ncbi:hypothetical protein PIB30_014571 [Stylosanthes scabra]|uniref:SPX domain-containing protein n=1 Tax=Stylosanthes scabra TaxID=79078 RepID=A0ABU6Z3L4_9FABA|nr:hypothetical protein [Stylosanthes scabra]
MNAIGLRKILKKFDKRLGYKFTDYYVKTRANHPYSQLRQVFRHVGFQENGSLFCRVLVLLWESYLIALQIFMICNNAKDATFLYMINLPILINGQIIKLNNLPSVLGKARIYHARGGPTISPNNYSLNLGAAASVCGVVIGSMAVAQVFSSVYFSAWSNRSYLRPLIFSSIVLLIGNTLYALAYDLNSLPVLLIGRLFCGLGSARAVNRRYISDCVPSNLRLQASAGFVSSSTLGMACGPALAYLLQKDFKIYKLTMNQDTLPGWVMALAWLIYLIWLWICFKEPSNKNQGILVSYQSNNTAGPEIHVAVEDEQTQPLLMNTTESNQQDEDEEEEDPDKETQKPITSIVAAYKLLTPSVKVQLYVYFMLKYAMEIRALFVSVRVPLQDLHGVQRNA